jgi:hypothetical protein
MSCAPCVSTSLGGALYHSHPESANAKSRAFIWQAQNEVVEAGVSGLHVWPYGPHAGGEGA